MKLNAIIVITTHVSFILLLSSCMPTSGEEHDDDYVDPTDLFNFDPASVSMKTSKKSNTNRVNTDPDTVSKDKCQSADTCDMSSRPIESNGNAEHSNKDKKGATGDQESSKIKQSLESSMALSRQFVNKLVYLLEPKVGTASSPAEINLRLKVSYHDIVKLRKFGQGSSNEIHDVYETLNSMVQFASEIIQPESSIYWLEVKTGLSSEVLWKVLYIVFVIFLILMVLSRLTVTRRMFYQLLFILFIISVVFNWIELYQKQLAEQDKILMVDRFSDRCPKMEELSFFGKITTFLSLSFTFQDESCREYFQAVVVSPLVKASPIEAVSVALVKTVVTPLGIIGTGIKAFFIGLLKDLPVQYQTLVIIILCVSVILLLFFKSGYYLRIFGVLSLGPAENRHTILGPAHTNQHGIESRAYYIQQRILHDQEEHQIINDVPPVAQRYGVRAVNETGASHLDASGQMEPINKQRLTHSIPGEMNQTDCEGALAVSFVNKCTVTKTSQIKEKVTGHSQNCINLSGDGSNQEAAPVVTSTIQTYLSKGEVTDSGQICMQESGDGNSQEAATVIRSLAQPSLTDRNPTDSRLKCLQESGDKDLVVTADSVHPVGKASVTEQVKNQNIKLETGTQQVANRVTDAACTDNTSQACGSELDVTERIESMTISRNS